MRFDGLYYYYTLLLLLLLLLPLLLLLRDGQPDSKALVYSILRMTIA